MGWTNPITFVVGATLTAAQLNANLRDNLNYLKSSATAQIATTEGTAAAPYVDLATVGPSVTLTTDTQARVDIGGQLTNSAMNGVATMGFTVSGATTIAGGVNGNVIKYQAYVAGGLQFFGRSFLITVNAGSNTFTCKYGAELVGTSTFSTRSITVSPS